MTNPWDQIFSNSKPEDLIEPYHMFQLILSSLKENESNKVLDIACGNGRHLEALLNGGIKEVFGFDLSKKAVELSREKIKKYNFANNVVQGNMYEKFPYNNSSFDGIIAIQAIYHGNKKNFENSIKEARRILKKNKPFIFTVSRDYKRSMLGSEEKNFLRIDNFTIIPQTGREKGLMHFYPDKETIENIVKKYFDSIKIVDDDKGHYYIVFCN